jgi:choline kinase
MTGVILLAGEGRRLGKKIPKCLNTVGGKTILERQLSSLKKVGVEKAVCVVGYERQQVQRCVTELWNGDVRFVENGIYKTTNTIYSLWLAIRHVEDDFIYMNGDVAFRTDLLDRLLGQPGDGVLGIVVKNCQGEEVKVVVEDGRILEIGKNIPPDRCLGEFVGVALFRRSMLDLFKRSLENMVEGRGIVDKFFEAGLAEIVHDVNLRAADVSDIPCIEVDFPEDLRWAEEHRFDFE